MTNKALIPLLAITLLSGCASIVCPCSYSVSVASNVKGTKVTIYNRDEKIDVVSTPTDVTLSPKAGFFVPADYRFVFEKEGFSTDEMKLEANFNWWYVGNFVFGGLIGWLIVDPATGAMWKINETSVIGSLKSLVPQGGQIELPQREVVPSWIFQTPNGSDTQKEIPRDGQSVEIDQIPL